MNQELMEIVLPRLAERLHKHLKRYQSGKLDEDGFPQRFHHMLEQQFTWLSNRGVAPVDAAMAIHAAVLVLSGPGLRTEAEATGLPLEQIEFRALQLAAKDVARKYGLSESRVSERLARI